MGYASSFSTRFMPGMGNPQYRSGSTPVAGDQRTGSNYGGSGTMLGGVGGISQPSQDMPWWGGGSTPSRTDPNAAKLWGNSDFSGVPNFGRDYPTTNMSPSERVSFMNNYSWDNAAQAWVPKGRSTGSTGGGTSVAGSSGGGSFGGYPSQGNADRNKYIQMIKDMMGKQGPAGPNLSQFQGEAYKRPEEWWSGDGAGAEGMKFNLSEAMKTFRPRFDQEMGQAMGASARRLGAEGGLMGSEYSGAVANAEVNRDRGLAEAVLPYQFQADSQTANMTEAARQAELARMYGQGQTLAGFEQQGQLSDQDRAFQAWNAWNNQQLNRYGVDSSNWQGGMGNDMNLMQMLLAYGG